MKDTVVVALAVTLSISGCVAPPLTLDEQTLTAEIRRQEVDAAGIIKLLENLDFSDMSRDLGTTIDELDLLQMQTASRVADLTEERSCGPLSEEEWKFQQQWRRVGSLTTEILKLRLEKAIALWEYQQYDTAMVGFDETRQSVRELSSSRQGRLRSDAGELWEKYPAVTADIMKSRWPASFHRFEPVGVQRDDKGIHIVTAKTVGRTAGLYIVVEPEYDPMERTRAIYDLLAEGIYWTLR